MLLRACLCWCLLVGSAWAGSDTTRDSLDRLQEILDLRVEDGRISPQDVVPAVLVSTQPRYEESQAWYATRVIEVLSATFGDAGLRLCEACMVPRAHTEHGKMTYQTGPIGMDEVIRLDDANRGDSQPARSAIWVDEHRGGLAIRIVDLRTSRVIFAQNIDPNMVENKNTKRMYTLAEEQERRARGDSLTQGFVDATMYPGQHLSIDWTDQWGKRNHNLSGLTFSFFDPIVGIGACHYRRLKFFNVLLGGKVILSLPTTLARTVQDGQIDLLDPLLTGVVVARVPFGRSNYGALLTASSNGEIGIGLSLMNISLLPVIP